MHIQINDYPVLINKQLIALIEYELRDWKSLENISVLLHFRDPEYSAQFGGYHPVTICVSAQGRIQWIADLSFMGLCLTTELEFHFEDNLCKQMGVHYPLNAGAHLFKIWQSNFCDYYQSGVFQTTIERL
jgi:hypothetical protein